MKVQLKKDLDQELWAELLELEKGQVTLPL